MTELAGVLGVQPVVADFSLLVDADGGSRKGQPFSWLRRWASSAQRGQTATESRSVIHNSWPGRHS